jgi:hypothetical protein
MWQKYQDICEQSSIEKGTGAVKVTHPEVAGSPFPFLGRKGLHI